MAIAPSAPWRMLATRAGYAAMGTAVPHARPKRHAFTTERPPSRGADQSPKVSGSILQADLPIIASPTRLATATNNWVRWSIAARPPSQIPPTQILSTLFSYRPGVARWIRRRSGARGEGTQSTLPMWKRVGRQSRHRRRWASRTRRQSRPAGPCVGEDGGTFEILPREDRLANPLSPASGLPTESFPSPCGKPACGHPGWSPRALR